MNQQAREIVDYLGSVGASAIRIEHGGKHLKAIFLWRGAERFYVMPCTPGDTMRGTRNAIRDIRHMLGLVETRKQIGSRRPRQVRRRPPSVSVPALANVPIPDWRDTLAAHPAAIAALAWRADAAWVAWWRGLAAAAGWESRLFHGTAEE